MFTRPPAARILLNALGGLGVLGALGLASVPARAAQTEGTEIELRVDLHSEGVELQVDDEPARATGTTAPPGQRLRLVVEATVDVEGWRARLSNPDLDARELAFDQLVARARDDFELRLALRSWTTDPAAGELAWGARLALRELQRQGHPPRPVAWIRVNGGSQGAPRVLARPTADADVSGGEASPDSPMQRSELLRRFELHEDASQEEILPLSDPPRISSLYFPRQFQMPQSPHELRVTRRFHLDIQPEGVVLTEWDLSGGSQGERRYAAGSVEGLLDQHPHLRHQVPGLSTLIAKPFAPGSQFGWGSESPLFRFDPALVGSRGSRPAAGAAEYVTTLVLGVNCTQLSGEDAQGRMLGPGVGLRIERREPGSVAEALGLQRGDILIELGGQPLCSFEEISRVLRERPGRSIEVKFIDRSGIERQRTWIPENSKP
jgi:hypothetical protein